MYFWKTFAQKHLKKKKQTKKQNEYKQSNRKRTLPAKKSKKSDNKTKEEIPKAGVTLLFLIFFKFLFIFCVIFLNGKNKYAFYNKQI